MTPFHYSGGAPKPLALSQDEILTNSGAWRVLPKQSKVSIEKLSLPPDLKLNAETSKLMTIKQVRECDLLFYVYMVVLIELQGGKAIKILLNVVKTKVILVNLQEGHENYGLQTLLAEEIHDITW